jgi:diguanylate cyclase (GGDEF)-like protein
LEKLTNPNDLGQFNKLLMRHFAGELSHFDFECRMNHKNGHWVWIHNRGRVVTRTSDGKPLMMFGTLTDITRRKQTEERLKYLSFHDQLTGVYNRAYLENEMKRLNKSREYPVAIISIDVDGLKLVNDAHGHEFGDKLLIQCVALLQETLRKSDILARYGGDEFVAFLPRTDYQTGSKIVARIREKIEKHNLQKQDQLPLSFSMGMAVAEDAENEISAAFKEADDLMYLDKMKKDVSARSQIIRSLMATMKERTFIKNGHLHRLENLCRLVGEKVQLSAKQLCDLALLAQVHDLGKVGIPDHILFKPSPLTEEEWKIMRKHPENGNRIARASIDLAEIADLILKHRERWDGKGYPLGLKGEEIPIECRILAIVDAYDAMINFRPYRKTMSITEAREEIITCAGTQFDPDLVEVFLEVLDSEDQAG